MEKERKRKEAKATGGGGRPPKNKGYPSEQLEVGKDFNRKEEKSSRNLK